jgi:hypothetical protein
MYGAVDVAAGYDGRPELMRERLIINTRYNDI